MPSFNDTGYSSHAETHQRFGALLTCTSFPTTHSTHFKFIQLFSFVPPPPALALAGSRFHHLALIRPYKLMIMFRMMMQRSILIQLACLALVGSANAAYDFEACSKADCGEKCSSLNCASKSREAFVLSLHRRWVCCSCLYVTMYSLRVYSVRYSKYLRSFSN